LLIAVDAERTRAWRVDTKAGALVEMKMPRLGYSKGIGAARGDRAWLVGTLANDPMVRPIEVDLRTGAWRVIDCDDSGAEGLDLEAIQDLGDDLLLWHRGGSTEDLVRYDPDDGSCVRQPLPVYSEVETQGVAELDDGRQVLLLHAAAADNSLIELLAVHDPAEGGWRTDPTECSPGWHDDALNHIGWRDTTLIALGGRVSFPTWVTEEDGSAQWELVHVRLP
jgi:hypothetical protein